MKNFLQIYSLILIIIQSIGYYNPIDCEDVELPQTDEDFWQWIWGQDLTQNDDHKPVDHIKEELKYHYGNSFSLDSLGLDSLFQEFDFHMFNLHDFDKNKLLDGLEMMSMLASHDSDAHTHHKTHSFEQNIAVIDMVLRTDDLNNDGYLDYNEFKSAKLKHNIKGL